MPLGGRGGRGRRLRFTAEGRADVAAAGVTVEQMRGRGKGPRVVEVRRIVAAYLRRRGCSLPEIGRVLNRDHTSVLYLLRAPASVAGLCEEWRRDVDERPSSDAAPTGLASLADIIARGPDDHEPAPGFAPACTATASR